MTRVEFHKFYIKECKDMMPMYTKAEIIENADWIFDSCISGDDCLDDWTGIVFEPSDFEK